METIMIIKTIDRGACRDISARAMEALKVVADELGLTVLSGAGSYSDVSYTFKAEFKVVGEAGEPADFARKAAVIGMPGDCWGAEVLLNRRAYKIVDINLKARSYPVLLERDDGKRFKYPVVTVKALLANAA